MDIQGIVVRDLVSGVEVSMTVGYMDGVKALALFVGETSEPVVLAADAVAEALFLEHGDE